MTCNSKSLLVLRSAEREAKHVEGEETAQELLEPPPDSPVSVAEVRQAVQAYLIARQQQQLAAAAAGASSSGSASASVTRSAKQVLQLTAT